VGDGNGTRRASASLAGAAVALVVAAVVVIAALYARAPRATRLHVGEIAPDFTLPVVTGGPPVRLSEIRGGPSVLIFFDTRWPGSDSYLQYLERMHRRYLRRGLRTIGVALDSDVARVRQFVARNELTFAVLSDPFAYALHQSYGTPRDPEAYLLDAQGRVLAVFTARIDWSTREFRERLEKHLQPAPPGR
jgi:peroxiredoxin